VNFEMFIYEVSQYFLHLSSQTNCCFKLVLSEIISCLTKFIGKKFTLMTPNSQKPQYFFYKLGQTLD
jgi:hypothetical protein